MHIEAQCEPKLKCCLFACVSLRGRHRSTAAIDEGDEAAALGVQFLQRHHPGGTLMSGPPVSQHYIHIFLLYYIYYEAQSCRTEVFVQLLGHQLNLL